MGEEKFVEWRAREGGEAENPARDELLAVIAHELRSPVSSIVMSIESLREVQVEGGIREAFDVIRRCADRILRLTEDLAEMADLQNGRFILRVESEDFAEIVAQSAAAASVLARERNIDVRVDIGELPPVPCDRDRISQVLANLLVNAFNVTDRGGTIAVRAAADKDEVVVEIIDNGPGIADADLPYVFDRYWRAKDVAYKGAGLGLAIAKAIVDAHHGRIWAESMPGAGSRFMVALPLEGSSVL